MKSNSILIKGDKIGLISPASFITKDKLETALLNLKNLELEPFFFSDVNDKFGYLAGNDQERIEELHKMYKNISVKAILCVRGGYGTTRILDKIDYGLIKKNPKPLIGYSDITALQSAIYKKTKIPGFHGIVGAKQFSDYTSKQFKDFFFADNEEIILKNPEAYNDNYTINSGSTEGKLIGGNLSLLCSLLGTGYDLDWKNKIIYIEETNEPPYKIDRMLTQLNLAGKFKKIKGIILGSFNKCEREDFEIQNDDSLSLSDIINDIVKPLNIPSVYGFSFGHIEDQAILPFGTQARFNADSSEIIIKRKVFKDFF